MSRGWIFSKLMVSHFDVFARKKKMSIISIDSSLTKEIVFRFTRIASEVGKAKPRKLKGRTFKTEIYE